MLVFIIDNLMTKIHWNKRTTYSKKIEKKNRDQLEYYDYTRDKGTMTIKVL